MCLFKTEFEPRHVETEPLKVYKVLQENDRSPCVSGFIYKRGVNKPVPVNCNDDSIHYHHLIEGGYLHAFRTRSAAQYFIQCVLSGDKTVYPPFKIVEMYVPVGSIYWNGLGEEIAASSLYWPEDEKTEN